jgi:hypothetical protein
MIYALNHCTQKHLIYYASEILDFSAFSETEHLNYLTKKYTSH